MKRKKTRRYVCLLIQELRDTLKWTVAKILRVVRFPRGDITRNGCLYIPGIKTTLCSHRRHQSRLPAAQSESGMYTSPLAKAVTCLSFDFQHQRTQLSSSCAACNFITADISSIQPLWDKVRYAGQYMSLPLRCNVTSSPFSALIVVTLEHPSAIVCPDGDRSDT